MIDALELALPLASAIGIVGIMALANRREIYRLEDGIFGHDRSRRNGGIEGDVDSLAETITEIRDTQDDVHHDLRAEIGYNRELIADVAEETGADLEVDV